MDVFFYEAFEEEQAALLRYLQDTPIKPGFSAQTIQELGESHPRAALISIRTQSVIPEAWAGLVSGILTRSTGYDHLLAYCHKTGTDVPCGYLPLYCNRGVAEAAMLLWMALLRKLPRQMEQFSTFQRDGLTGAECAGKTLLVVGVGHIGYEVVRIGRGLDMQVLGVDLVRKHADVRYVALEQGLGAADVIVCAMNLTASNHGFFNYDRLRYAKPGVIFVNIARGELAPPADLLRLLDGGHLAGVGLDVFDSESRLAVSLRSSKPDLEPGINATLELARRADVILTPHNAFNTAEAVERKAEHSLRQIEHFLMHGRFLWPIPKDEDNGAYPRDGRGADYNPS